MESIVYLCLAPFFLIPGMLLIFCVLETAGQIHSYLILRRFTRAADFAEAEAKGEIFADIMKSIWEEITVEGAAFSPIVYASAPKAARVLVTEPIDWRFDYSEEETQLGLPIVESSVTLPVGPESVLNNPYYVSSGMLRVGQGVSGSIHT